MTKLIIDQRALLEIQNDLQLCAATLDKRIWSAYYTDIALRTAILNLDESVRLLASTLIDAEQLPEPPARRSRGRPAMSLEQKYAKIAELEQLKSEATDFHVKLTYGKIIRRIQRSIPSDAV